jgi:hypothetical protein
VLGHADASLAVGMEVRLARSVGDVEGAVADLGTQGSEVGPMWKIAEEEIVPSLEV